MISRVLDEYIRLLVQARCWVDNGDSDELYRMFSDSRDYRDSLPDSSKGMLQKEYTLYCDIYDEAGGIATIATLLAMNNINIKNIGIVHNREFEGRRSAHRILRGGCLEKIRQGAAGAELPRPYPQLTGTTGGIFMEITQAKKPLKGTVTVPGDKSVSHRAVMLGALARGTTRIRNFLQGADCLSTIGCFSHMGIQVENLQDEVLVHGKGLHGLSAPGQVLDVGNSGTTTRLISGILAGSHFPASLPATLPSRAAP